MISSLPKFLAKMSHELTTRRYPITSINFGNAAVTFAFATDIVRAEKFLVESNSFPTKCVLIIHESSAPSTPAFLSPHGNYALDRDFRQLCETHSRHRGRITGGAMGHGAVEIRETVHQLNGYWHRRVNAARSIDPSQP